MGHSVTLLTAVWEGQNSIFCNFSARCRKMENQPQMDANSLGAGFARNPIWSAGTRHRFEIFENSTAGNDKRLSLLSSATISKSKSGDESPHSKSLRGEKILNVWRVTCQ